MSPKPTTAPPEFQALLCFKKTLSDEQRLRDPLGRDSFDLHWMPVGSFVRPDGQVKTRKLLRSWLRIEMPGVTSFFGGFLFFSGGVPWGFTRQDVDFLPQTADYLSYTRHWLDVARRMIRPPQQGVCPLSIYSAKLELRWGDGVGVLRDHGSAYGSAGRLEPLHFAVEAFCARILEQSRLYQQVYADVMRLTRYAANDPARRHHVEMIHKGVPSLRAEHQALEDSVAAHHPAPPPPPPGWP